ncbi:acyltransferase family protein [Jeotgalibacillus aurantiacus]|uniref:acyltransferase family protein n=1 Tax=Jeotgalibacillus aurantiacus TaxID=2763266 RepID=UPI001D0ABD4A|nr:acyltransferase family protein [Jeotgalibacillus aurantiacus]
MKKERITGIDWIRAFACLSVVWIHAVTQVLANYDLPIPSVEIAKLSQMAFIFATPMFVMISEYLLSYSYQSKAPQGFWKKRILYILVPYFTMATAYAVFNTLLNTMTIESFLNAMRSFIFFAGWHGYFIIIIFQFYVLHFIFNKYILKYNPYFVTAISLAINIAFLHYFRMTESPGGAIFDAIWQSYARVMFPAWIVFFVIAYYAGRYSGEWMAFIRRAGSGILLMAVMAMLFIFYNVVEGHYIVVSSRRVDVLFYTVLVFLTGLYLTTYIKGVPKFIKLISKYSFSIYLLHMMVLILFSRYLPIELPALVFGITAFIIGTFGSIVLAWMIKKIPGSSLLIGQVDRPAKKPDSTPVLQTRKAN